VTRPSIFGTVWCRTLSFQTATLTIIAFVLRSEFVVLSSLHIIARASAGSCDPMDHISVHISSPGIFDCICFAVASMQIYYDAMLVGRCACFGSVCNFKLRVAQSGLACTASRSCHRWQGRWSRRQRHSSKHAQHFSIAASSCHGHITQIMGNLWSSIAEDSNAMSVTAHRPAAAAQGGRKKRKWHISAMYDAVRLVRDGTDRDGGGWQTKASVANNICVL
jgi:hypothetical protein